MGLAELSIDGVRNLQAVRLTPFPGVNCFHGDNGAGKTSVLEAIHLLGRGRSFRAGQISAAIQHGRERLQIAARLADDGLRIGLERSRDSWRGRIAGQDSQRLSEFAAALPLVLVEPDSHRLVDGGPDRRRQFLDWQLFHVEPDYLTSWQRYARLLRQRNAALKSGAETSILVALERPMVIAAEHIGSLRAAAVDQLGSQLGALCQSLKLRLPPDLVLRYRPGHPADRPLAEAWAEQRDSDRERGFTQRGPHRAELYLGCNGQPAATELSRGQQKLLALSLLLAQLTILEQAAPRQPLLLLDDPVSELDTQHLGELFDWLPSQAFQTWMSCTERPPRAFRMFHVKQGRIVPESLN